MQRVTRRPLAAADILDIWDHIAEDSVEQADRWVDKLDEKFELIATQPLMGRARDELAACSPAHARSKGRSGRACIGCPAAATIGAACARRRSATRSSTRRRR
jgi:plasmid stabilization system protein ParE